MNTIIVRDNFCKAIEAVRQSALQSGFATWKPNKGAVGSSIYDGMNFQGLHSIMILALSEALNCARIFPNSMFFRVTTPETEAAYVHSDRHSGSHTCVAYLSDHNEVSGTAFYRHRKTGLLEMPTAEQMTEEGTFDMFSRDMVNGGHGENDPWEQLDFIRGVYNRAVIFHAPLFHSRVPRNGIGDGNPETARMVWVCHFETLP